MAVHEMVRLGSHSVYVVACADGYSNSEPSESVIIGKTTSNHTISFSDNCIVTVNGYVITSPTVVQDDDSIELSRDSGYQSFLIVAGSNSWDSDSTTSPLVISNSDITITDGGVSMSPSAKSFYIHYGR